MKGDRKQRSDANSGPTFNAEIRTGSSLNRGPSQRATAASTGATQSSSWNSAPIRAAPATSGWGASPVSSAATQSNSWNSNKKAVDSPSSSWGVPTSCDMGMRSVPENALTSGNVASGWGAESTDATPTSGWDAPIERKASHRDNPARTVASTTATSGWDAPIERSGSHKDNLPARKVASRDAELQELFGSGDHPASNSGINFDKYDDIPVDLKGPRSIKPIDSFSDVDLHPTLRENIGRSRYARPTPVQKYAIPIILGTNDMMACAQTGSGKTAAFLVPAIQALVSGRYPQLSSESTSSRVAYPQVLILSPTRELAIQIHFEARKFCFDTDATCAIVYGGQDLRIQSREISFGADLLVATPGRLTDFLERKRISLKNVRLLIIDEADRMLDMGFEPQIRRIIEQSDMPCSGRESRQTVMFSATFPASIQRLASCFLTGYLHLSVGRVGSTSASITQILEYAEDHQKRDVLLEWLPKVNGLVVVFVQTKRTADLLADWFRRQKIEAACIHGDRTQSQREDALQDFRVGKVKYLIATDVAARGLDIANVMWVINYDLPNTIDDYVHRIGRTGRCGNIGTALSFFHNYSGMIIHHIYDLFQESGQTAPPFLEGMIKQGVFERNAAAQRQRGGGGRPRSGRGQSGRQGGAVFKGADAKVFEIG